MDQQPNKTTKGSTIVEVTIVAAVISMLIGGVLLVLYLSFARVWVKSALYDGLICVREARPQFECQKIVKSRLDFLPFGTSSALSLEESGDGRVAIRIKSNLTLHVQQSLPEGLR